MNLIRLEMNLMRAGVKLEISGSSFSTRDIVKMFSVGNIAVWKRYNFFLLCRYVEDNKIIILDHKRPSQDLSTWYSFIVADIAEKEGNFNFDPVIVDKEKVELK